jgi:invasion protein IalB
MTTTRLMVLAVLFAVLLPVAAHTETKAKAKPKAQTESTPAVPVASDPGPAKPLGNFGSWTAYLAQNKSGKVCYLIGQPEKAEPAATKRKTVMAMVTHRTEDNVANVVSFDEGYPLKEDAAVGLQVGAEKFELFAKDDSAWARTSDLDRAIVTALAKEKQAVIKATPKKGHATTHTYSLAGFSKTLALIDKACDVKR